jgi:hypothetical protein
MNGFWWWLVETSAGLLDADEREAVLGDVLESGDSGPRAFVGVLGLVMRRQVVLWMNWRPWVVLVAVVLPFGFLLSIIARETSNGSAIYIWMYANNWDWALTRNPGFWRLLGQTTISICLTYLTLGCWSWGAGFVLGFLSRGMERIHGLLLCLTLMLGELGAPLYFEYLLEYERRVFGLEQLVDGNRVVFDLAFYQVVLPLIVQVVLVMIPALWGMRQARSGVKAGRFLHLALAVAAMATLMEMVTHELPGFWLLAGPRIATLYPLPPFWNSVLYVRRWLEPIQYWPIIFLVAHAIRRRNPRAVVV